MSAFAGDGGTCRATGAPPLLFEVLGFSATEITTIMDTSITAVTSARR